MIFAVNTVTVFAESAEITASVSSLGRLVTVTGNISSGEGKNISIEVRDESQNLVYVNQIKSGADGNFSINFSLQESAPYGQYFVTVGGEGVTSPAYELFSYTDKSDTNTETITVNVTNLGRFVTVTGNITSGEGKNIFVVVQDPKQNVVYENQIVSGAGGNFSINFSLAENAAGGLYFVILNGDGVENPVYNLFSYMGGSEPAPAIITAEVTNTGKNVTVTGNISTGEGKQITLDVKDENDNVIYQGQTESVAEGSFVITFSLPETAQEGIYNITVGGTNVDVPVNLTFTYTIPKENYIYVTAVTNSEFNVYMNVVNLNDIDEYVTYFIKYDINTFTPIDLCGLTSNIELEEGVIPGTTIKIEYFNSVEGVIKYRFEASSDNNAQITNFIKFKSLKNVVNGKVIYGLDNE